jgi:MATE family multidrug resistance protein
MAILTEWTPFLQLALPGAGSMFLEWGSFELMAGLAGRLGDTSLAAHGIFATTSALLYMVPQALADATATVTGNSLGDAKAGEAKIAVVLGFGATIACGVFNAALLACLRDSWGAVFTNDPDVLDAVSYFLPVVYVYILIDSCKCIALNILRSTGRPQVTAVGNFLACLFVMLPCGWLFGLHFQFDLFGIWGAMSLAWMVATALYIKIIYSTNWEAQVQSAKRRNASGGNDDRVNDGADEGVKGKADEGVSDRSSNRVNDGTDDGTDDTLANGQYVLD